MYDQRFIFVEGDNPCIYDKVGKRKYYFNDDLCDRLNECRGKLQVTNAPNFYMGRISALKEALRLYGVDV